MLGIRKAFGAVEVLHGVDFAVRAGRVHALVGENGAGKSTLIKILGGVYQDYRGRLALDGAPVQLSGPRDAEAHGIAVIHQELALVPHMTVAENVFLGHEPTFGPGLLHRAALHDAAKAIFRESLALDLDVTRTVADLPLAARQLTEIAKALARRARLLVLDEPTSALGAADAARLFAAIRGLRARGVGLVYISHKLDEIYALADEITVLRDGERVGTLPAADLPPAQLVQWMVGRTIEQFFPSRAHEPGAARLEVRDLHVRPARTGRSLVAGVSLQVRAGEVVGLAGLMGSGASDVLGAIFGRSGPPARGEIRVEGQLLRRPTPRAAIARGLALLTSDRQASGLVLPMSVLHNLSLATLSRCCRAGLMSGERERRHCGATVEQLKLRAPSLEAPVTALSGGNQQKVVLGRWLLTTPQVLLLDEPTRGIDVGAKADIYALLDELTARGLAILLVTSELPELLALADRILVMHRGRITAELRRHEATQERILHAAMGG
jgi:ribose transport system ATP-binding protein